MNVKKTLGDWGEDRAALYLQLRGYRILARNFRCRQGEIDIVARKDDIVAFVEVKLRKNADYGEAREFVTYSKQRRILSAANLWLMRNNCELQPRFDVIEIYAPDGAGTRRPEIHHLVNAFS
jgi:conserved hypothetical protein TIGR00252